MNVIMMLRLAASGCSLSTRGVTSAEWAGQRSHDDRHRSSSVMRLAASTVSMPRTRALAGALTLRQAESSMRKSPPRMRFTMASAESSDAR